jgi:hypothetical protein
MHAFLELKVMMLAQLSRHHLLTQSMIYLQLLHTIIEENMTSWTNAIIKYFFHYLLILW